VSNRQINGQPSLRVLFGRRIRVLRRDRGFSQERFAYHAGLDRSYVGGIERGQRNVSLDNVAVLARALDLPVYELFLFDGPNGSDAPGK